MKIIEEFRVHADEERVEKQVAYLRKQFKFLALSSPLFLKEDVQERAIDWAFIHKLCLKEREFQSLACDCLRKMKKYLHVSDLPKIYQLAHIKSCWETVDRSKDENFCICRIVINC